MFLRITILGECAAEVVTVPEHIGQMCQSPLPPYLETITKARVELFEVRQALNL